ncbi:tyrosine-type recombinase/integrase [Tenacibaculum maritimum]|uniref:tyrosine-type recombinase/integrase n=1 Tax=Tenacibaculum maritimum TaxID=107401 RepID=UPI003876CE56
MKIKFFTRSNSNIQAILVRVYHSKVLDQTTSTGISVLKDTFSNTYQKVKNKSSIKNKDAINSKLNELKGYLLDCYNDTALTDNNFYKNWLKDRVNKFFNRVSNTENYKKYLIEWADHYIKNETLNKKTGMPITGGTQRKYKTVLSNLKAFEDYKKTKILLKSIDYDFYKDFVNFCLKTKGYTQNTTGTRVRTLKTWIKEANRRGFCNVDLTDFKTMSNETKDVYLTDLEINTIFNHNFSNDLKLSNVRDLLIIGVRTGLRVSDFMRLNVDNINGNFIEIKTQKTGANVVIPIHPQIKAILKRNNGSLPRSISDQRFNEYLKDVCEIAGITTKVEGGKQNPETKRKEYGIFSKHELITSHTCRRSFASNLYGKIDNVTIMGITGHRTEKEFLKYIKITPRQHAESLQLFYSKQEKENKGSKDVPMRIAK